MTGGKLGIVMDPIESIKPWKDSSFAMLLEAQQRGWQIYYMTIDDLYMDNNVSYANYQRLRLEDDNQEWFSKTDSGICRLDELDVIGPDTYARDGYPHGAWRRLRRESPIHWFDLPGGTGFWAVTRRADVVWISKQPERFINAPRLAVFEQGAPIEGERRFVRQSTVPGRKGSLRYWPSRVCRSTGANRMRALAVRSWRVFTMR